MNSSPILMCFAAAALAAGPSALFAGGVRLASQDGFATARGEAFAATADNASAIYYNPAGITQLQGSTLRGGIYGIYFDPTFTQPSAAGGATFHVENKVAAVPQGFLTLSLSNSPFSFGCGLYSPYGLGVSWPQDTGFRAVALESALLYVRLNPVVAVKLPGNLSIGAGVMIDYAKISLEQGLRPTKLPPPFSDFFRFEGDGWSVGYNVGARWQPHPTLAFGATFRSSTPFTMDGHTDVQFFPIISSTHRSPAHADFTFPWTAAVGVSWRPTPDWNLEFNADYTEWSSFGTVTVFQSNPHPIVQPNPSFKLGWQGSWMYEFGVTRYLDNHWHVSAGYVFNENSAPDANYTPLVPDEDRHFFTLGAGHVGQRFDVDVAYQFGYGPARRVTGSTPSTVGQINGQTADGTYDFISHAVMVTVGMHF